MTLTATQKADSSNMRTCGRLCKYGKLFSGTLRTRVQECESINSGKSVERHQLLQEPLQQQQQQQEKAAGWASAGTTGGADVSHLHLQKGRRLTKGHRQLWRPTEEATQKMAMTQMAARRQSEVKEVRQEVSVTGRNVIMSRMWLQLIGVGRENEVKVNCSTL